MKQYTKSHEWIDANGKVGVSAHAIEQLGDVVFVELPDEGDDVTAGDSCAVIESHKAASDIYAPATGTVTVRNEAVVDSPEDINAEGDLWLFSINLADGTPANLMDEAAYLAYIESES